MKNSIMKLYWNFAGSLALSFFMILGYIVKFYEGTILKIDTPIMNWILTIRSISLTHFFSWITKFGNTLSIAFIVLALLAFLWKLEKRIEMYWLVINTALISGLGNFLVKFLFTRERPSIEHLVTATHYSFPSGHAMASMLLYGTLILLIMPYAKGHPLLRTIQILLGSLILLIGMSRVYLGVHYPSDILGGFLLGFSWLGFSYPIFVQYRLKQVFSHTRK